MSVNGCEDLWKAQTVVGAGQEIERLHCKDPNYQEALKEWAKQSDIREGRRIGVLPYGRKFILEHPDSGMRMKPYEGRDQLAVDRVNDITSCRQER